MPVALALAVWFMAGRVRRPFVAATVAGAVGIVVLILLRLTQVLGGSSEKPEVSFDRGQFAQNVLLGLAPLCVATAVALLSPRRRWSIWWVLMLACVAVPTFVALGGSRTGESALSMKIATLLAAAAAPVAAEAARYAMTHRVVAVVLICAILVGVAHSAVMLVQFPAARFTGRGGKHASMPRDYHDLLSDLRSRTQVGAVIADSLSDVLPETLGTLLVAERRVYLPTTYTEPFLAPDVRDRLLARSDRFSSWKRREFKDRVLSRDFAGEVDYLIVPSGASPAGEVWREFARRGGYVAYSSQLRAATRPTR
jgi:hypothetical protein